MNKLLFVIMILSGCYASEQDTDMVPDDSMEILVLDTREDSMELFIDVIVQDDTVEVEQNDAPDDTVDDEEVNEGMEVCGTKEECRLWCIEEGYTDGTCWRFVDEEIGSCACMPVRHYCKCIEDESCPDGRLQCGDDCCPAGDWCCEGECSSFTDDDNCGACGNTCLDGWYCDNPNGYYECIEE